MKGFEVVELFTDAGELDRLAGDLLHAQGRAAAGVAVELGQDRARDVEGLVEVLGDIDSLLTDGGVEDEQGFRRLHLGLEIDQFLDQFLVDLEAAGGVEEKRVALGVLGVFQGFARDFEDALLLLADKGRHFQLIGQGLQLVHGRRSIDVAGDEHRFAALFGEEFGELACGGRLAGTVEPDHHDAGGFPCEFDAGIGGAQQFNQFVVDDFDDLLAGLNALDDLDAERLLLHPLDEIAGNLEIDVGVQQRHTHLAQGLRDIVLGDFSESAEVLERLLQFLA